MEITSLGNKKSPRSLHLGNKDRMNILRYHLVCRRSDHLMQMPTHPLPSNAGNASEDTRDEPFPPALDGPFANPLFAPLSALRNSLWMRCRLYFRLNDFIFKLCLLYTFRVRLSSTFFHSLRTIFTNWGGMRDTITGGRLRFTPQSICNWLTDDLIFARIQLVLWNQGVA